MRRRRLRVGAEQARGRGARLGDQGEFMGARQSGDALLRFADLRDTALIAQARGRGARLLSTHPQAAAAHVERWLASRAEFL